MPEIASVGGYQSEPPIAAGGFNRSVGGAPKSACMRKRYLACRICKAKKAVVDYIQLAENQLPLETVAVIARSVLQELTGIPTDVRMLVKLERRYESSLPSSASTFPPATLATSCGQPVSNSLILAGPSFRLPPASGSHSNSGPASSYHAPRDRASEPTEHASVPATLDRSSSAPALPRVSDPIYISSAANSDSELDSLPNTLATRKRGHGPALDNNDDEPPSKRRSDSAATKGDAAHALQSAVIDIISAMRPGLGRLSAITKIDTTAAGAPPINTAAAIALHSAAAAFLATTTTPSASVTPAIASDSTALPEASALAAVASLRKSSVDVFNRAQNRGAREYPQRH